MTDAADWIAADWDGTVLHLWSMAGRVPLDVRRVATEAAALAPARLRATLDQAAAEWPGLPVLACGLILSPEGWEGTPLIPVPCPATPSQLTLPGAGRAIHAVAGLSQDLPPDLLTGDETRIAGLLDLSPDFDGVVCLPGAQTAWVRVSAGEICNFKTFPTLSLLAAVATISPLRDIVATQGPVGGEAFQTALSEAMTRPERGLAALSEMRARAVLSGPQPAQARARLTGTLIGWELAAARPWWLGCAVTIIGTPDRADPYAKALSQLGITPARMSAQDATLAGLTVARRGLS